MLYREEERMPDMAKRNQNTFLKRQKEIKRQQKAQEKMARRHGEKAQEAGEIDEDAAAPAVEGQETATDQNPADQNPEDHTKSI
jgi:hypothetical protein